MFACWVDDAAAKHVHFVHILGRGKHNFNDLVHLIMHFNRLTAML